MTTKFKTINLSRVFNSPAKLRTKATKTRPGWHPSVRDLLDHIPRGSRTFWGIPFRLGPKDMARNGLIELSRGFREVEVPLQAPATHMCILHFCNTTDDPDQTSGGGEVLAEYVLGYADGREHTLPIRRRFELNAFAGGWGYSAFAAMPAAMPQVAPDDPTAVGWGFLQTGVTGESMPFQTWVYALANPCPEDDIARLVLRGTSE